MRLGIFKDHVFEGVSEEQLYKSQMNGLNDPTLRHFQLLSTSSLMKAEFKQNQYELEYIQSYLNAAKELADIGEQRTARSHAYYFYQHSYALPILYLVRHCLELCIKRAIVRSGRTAKAKHNLVDLWKDFLAAHDKAQAQADKQVLEQMSEFVSQIDKLDPTGTKLRYSTNKSGYSIDGPLWVDSGQVVKQLDLFVQQLESLDIAPTN